MNTKLTQQLKLIEAIEVESPDAQLLKLTPTRIVIQLKCGKVVSIGT